MVEHLILHGDGAAKHSLAHADPRVARVEQVQRVELATRAAAAGVGGGEIIGEEEADARPHERHEAGSNARHHEQRKQPPVDQQDEDHNGDRHRDPRGARHREQAGKAHQDRADPGRDLPFRVLDAVGEARAHRRNHDHKVAHDVGAAEDGIDAGTDGGLGMGHPAGWNGHGDDILVDAVQREQDAEADERTVEAHDVPVVPEDARDDEEPEQILARGAEAGKLDGEERCVDVHEHEAGGQEQQDAAVHRRGAGGEGRSRLDALPADPERGKEQQRLVPHRAEHRNGQHVAQDIVHARVEADADQDHPGHAAGEQPRENTAILPAAEHCAVNAAEQGGFDRGAELRFAGKARVFVRKCARIARRSQRAWLRAEPAGERPVRAGSAIAAADGREDAAALPEGREPQPDGAQHTAGETGSDHGVTPQRSSR